MRTDSAYLEALSGSILLAALPAGAIVLAPDGRCAAVNRSASEILGIGGE